MKKAILCIFSKGAESRIGRKRIIDGLYGCDKAYCFRLVKRAEADVC